MPGDENLETKIDSILDDRADELEAVALTGNAAAISVLRRLGDFRTLMRESSEGDSFGWELNAMLEPMLEAWNAQPALPKSFELRARALFANLLELSPHDNGHGDEWDGSAINRLRDEARSLLTGQPVDDPTRS